MRDPHDVLRDFDLDPGVVHLDHGAYGALPRVVARAWQDVRVEVETNPARFLRAEVLPRIARVRDQLTCSLGIERGSAALVRNVSEGLSTVLASLDLCAGDEVLVSDHGYGSVGLALRGHCDRIGARLVTVHFDVGADDSVVVDAFAGAVNTRTRLVVVDQITSPTAAVLPVAQVSKAVRAAHPSGEVTVAIDGAHVPGTLPTDIESLGADAWVGNLHKWMFTPRGCALLWVAERWRESIRPLVLSWEIDEEFPICFDRPGTADYTGWLAAPAGLDYWSALGGWDQTERNAVLVQTGQDVLAQALGTSLDGLHANPAPTMRLVRLPEGAFTDEAGAVAFYERLSFEHRMEVAPVWFSGSCYLRIAAQAYNTPSDYERLAEVLRSAPEVLPSAVGEMSA
ncbi:MAG: aminotransferase class V-fold PLP-dependent enzyme [Nocardioidaceae bacterium]|nr:aminotransferase class V-fold PLP-dependent enzyme [Nocardioidaceae bacterium]